MQVCRGNKPEVKPGQLRPSLQSMHSIVFERCLLPDCPFMPQTTSVAQPEMTADLVPLRQAQRPLPCVARCRSGSLRPAAPCRRVCSGAATDQAVGAESATKSGWDPEGLLDNAPKPSEGLLSDHVARRAARRRAQQVQLPDADELAGPRTDMPEGADVPAGLSRTAPASDGQAVPGQAKPVPGRSLAGDATLKAELASVLADQTWPLDLDRPGLEVLHLDPPVLRLPDFLDRKACESLTGLAAAGGLMQTSRVGGDNVAGAGSAQNVRRTSSTLLVNDAVAAEQPWLAAPILPFQESARQLTGDSGRPWGAVGKMPRAGQRCFESAQLACYQKGQQFMSHEDAFPEELARHNGFQRHVTVLVYLNDVAQGGATTFEQLGVSVQPSQGSALVFFPAFKDGRPDPRTVHCAQPAVGQKWILQQWIAQGWNPSASRTGGSPPPTRSLDSWIPSTSLSQQAQHQETLQAASRHQGMAAAEQGSQPTQSQEPRQQGQTGKQAAGLVPDAAPARGFGQVQSKRKAPNNGKRRKARK